MRLQTFNYWLACGFGLGWLGRFPGTVGTVAICPLIWWTSQVLSPLEFALIGVAGFLFGLYVCKEAIAYTGKQDPGQVIWDEFVGMWLAVIYLPMSPVLLLAAFVLFRLLDILKPPPISLVERHTPGGLGIMLDDVVAGLLTNAILQLALLGWWALA